jgi:hypothetical protein
VTTGKLRRTPPLLVNPLTLDATTNEFEYGDPSIGSTATSDGISSIDNHYIVRFAGNGGRTSALRLDGFGRAWIMGGNWSGANASMQFYNIADEVYVEGVRLDPGPGRDGIFGRGLSPAKRGRVSIARSHILGITGTNKAFSPALSAAAVSRGDGSSLTVLELPASVSVTNGQEVRVWGFTGANAAKYNGSYKASGDQTNTRVLTLRYYNNSGVPGPVERDATGGLFALDTGANTSRHGDGVQIDNQAGYTGTLSLDYLTIESAYQGIIAGLKVTTGIGNDGLEITRSNLTRNNGAPEPRDFNSYPLWIGGSDGAASDLQAKYRVGLLDMVYVENGPDWPGAGMSGVMDFPNWNMHPQSGTTRGGQPSSPFANGGGWSWPNATVNMPSYTGADGIVFEVENGQLPPGGHFATRSVTGIPTLAAPGFGYVPHPANYAAMPAPANPVITFAPDAITASASDGTRAGLFDCSNLSGGYIVMLAFTADGNAGGRFKLNGRRLERTATAAAAGSYSVTIRATLLDVTGAPTGHSSTTSFPVVVQ